MQLPINGKDGFRRDSIVHGTEMFNISDFKRSILKLDINPKAVKVGMRLGRVTMGCLT